MGYAVSVAAWFRVRHSRWRAILTAAGLLAARPGQAEPLSYHAPEGCPSKAEVGRSMEAELSRAGIFTTEETTIAIEVRDGGFFGTLRVLSGGAVRERTLYASSCKDVADGLLVILAFALGARKENAEEPRPESAPPVATAVPRSPPSREREAEVHFFAGVGAGMLLGAEPSLAPSARLSAGALLGPLLAEVYGTGALPNDGELGVQRGRATFLAGSIGANTCFVLGRAVAFGPCLGLEALIVRGSGRDLDTTHDRVATTLAPSGGARAALAIDSHLKVAVEAAGSFPIERPDFTLDGRVVHRASWLVGRAFLGGELWF
jgi:hypothetical protein